MPETLVRANLNLALDALRDLTSQITFDYQIGIYVLTDANNLTVGEIPHLSSPINLEIIEDQMRCRGAHPKYVGESNLDTLVSRKVGSRNTSHKTITPDAAYDAGWDKPPTRVRADG